MTKIESKIGSISKNEDTVFDFLSDFNNFKDLVPPDKVKNWESTSDSCRFSVQGLGETGMRIIEKEPNNLIKITGDEGSKFDFFFWIQLKQVAENDTKVRLTIKAELNPMLKMVATKPLKGFLDSLVEQMETFNY